MQDNKVMLRIGKQVIVSLVVLGLSGCVMMSSPELELKGVMVKQVEPPKGCAPKGNLVATANAMLETYGDEPVSLNRQATQDLIDQAVALDANYVHIVDHRQYSQQPRKGLVSRVVMKAKSFHCPNLKGPADRSAE